ncbi:PREDICTED: uncharacterized protein LOC106820147, partial [Priapulus caudatus]|uniref:Uncharacterized protein LOC106820147 n=1 Tax=Priapulus caudatus TaxID=37621 RepID=A0ABM1F6V7_PRICU
DGTDKELPLTKKRSLAVQSTSGSKANVCFYCEQFKVDLWEHRKRCQSKKDLNSGSARGSGVKKGRLLLPVKTSHKKLWEKILCRMNDDEVKAKVEGDRLIIELGNRLYDRHGHDVHQHSYISQKMRELGRLLVVTSKMEKPLYSILACLMPTNWDTLIEGVRGTAKYEEVTNEYSTPSLALKIGHSLRKCAEILQLQSVKSQNDDKEEMKKIADDFILLYNNDWNHKISLRALCSLDKQRYNNPKLLPLMADVIKLERHLRKFTAASTASLKNETDILHSYTSLAKGTLTQLILFNRRRAGETERVKVEELDKALKSQHELGEEDMAKVLTKFEMHLVHTHIRIETRGKRGRKVPILIPRHIVENVKCLREKREEAGVSGCFLFGRRGAAIHPYGGSACLREFAKDCGAEHPDRLTSTRLRQQLATMCQVLNLSEENQDQLATFMGHNLIVHRQFYRLTENILQAAKVSKILHLMNTDRLADFKGKNYDEITFDEEEALEDEPSDEEDNTLDETSAQPSTSSGSPGVGQTSRNT